jgi:hypothetical protein
MVGDRRRAELGARIKEATDKAGALVAAAFALAAAALLLALGVFVFALRTRRRP